jgi:hypothetical protein
MSLLNTFSPGWRNRSLRDEAKAVIEAPRYNEGSPAVITQLLFVWENMTVTKCGLHATKRAAKAMKLLSNGFKSAESVTKNCK